MKPIDDTEWTPDEARALRDLAEPVRPAAVLERRIVDRLRAEGEIEAAPRNGWPTLLRSSLAVAAGLILFAMGVWVGERATEPATPASATAGRYMVLLYEDAAYAQPAAGRELNRVTEYASWAADVRAGGVEIRGDELTGDERLLQPAGDSISIEPGLPRGPLGRIAGFFLVESDDAQAVLGLARTMPHLRYGGRIGVVRLAGH